MGDAAHRATVTDVPAGHDPFPGASDDGDDGDRAISAVFDEDAWADEYGSLFDRPGVLPSEAAS